MSVLHKCEVQNVLEWEANSIMEKNLHKLGLFTIKSSDLLAGSKSMDNQNPVRINFFAKLNMDFVSLMNLILNQGQVPIALVVHDENSDEYSMYTPQSLPEWLRRALSQCAPGFTHYPLGRDIRDCD